VIDQALLDLERDGRPRRLMGGYTKMTMLDPHPANNSYGNRYSANLLSRVGRAAVLTEYLFNAAAQDPITFQIPSFVNWSESFYQHTPVNQTRDLKTLVLGLNLWGVSSIPGLNNQVDLTLIAPGISHITITDWYEMHLRG